MRYELGLSQIDELLGGVPEGTNLLVKGTSVSGRDDFVRAVVTQGIGNDNSTVYVTTDRSADEILETYSCDNDRLGVVDCVTKSRGVEEPEETETVKFASSPSDMTGVGVKVSTLLERIRDRRGIEGNRVLVESVSTLLMYSNLETVFRFLHVFTGRIRSIDGIGIFVIDSEMHDEKDYHTLRQLFDGVVEVESEDGETRVRIVGLMEEPTEWIRLTDDAD
ncbi:MAG: ATPase domain-containing protein [Halobacteriales archaeon]|nr:ATPase domain-containing protein [Halobacteriales archaeon]